MTITVLKDITKCGIGSVAVARATSVTLQRRDTRVESDADGFASAQAIDTTMQEILASIQAQDPLAVPLVLALTGAQTLVVGGRVVNAATFEDHTLQRMVLTGFGFDLIERQPGTCSFDLQNRATTGNTPDDEWAAASGTAQAVATRLTTLRILETGTAFTDDATIELALAGVERVSLRARPLDLTVGVTTGEQILADLVDVYRWGLSGSMTLRDSTLATTQAVAQRLAALRRGDLTVAVRQMAQDDTATAPTDKVIGINRAKFFNPRRTGQRNQEAVWEVDFDCVAVSVAGEAMTLAQLITVT